MPRPIVVGCLGLAWVMAFGCGSPDPTPERRFVRDAGADGQPGAEVQGDSGVAPSSGILVEEVFDGDTIRLQASASHRAPDGRPLSGVKVRLLGIDAPEIEHPPRPAECWGDESSAFAEALLGGRFIELAYDLDRDVRDPYDRLLAYVVLEDGRVANEVLLEAGEARMFRAFPHRDRDRYEALERAARRAGLGLWSCP